MIDYVSRATKAAIRHAKHRKSKKVTNDDLLIGLLQVIARFDIVQIGSLTIDLEEFGETFKDDIGKTNVRKVAYSSETTAILEKAAYIAKKDNAPKVEIVHLLVAFANEDSGLMAQLKEKFGISGKEWRAALSEWHPVSWDTIEPGSKMGAETSPLMDKDKQFFSPDEAAEFLGVHTQTVRGYIRTGKLPALRLAGERALRIQRSDLLALLEPYNPEET